MGEKKNQNAFFQLMFRLLLLTLIFVRTRGLDIVYGMNEKRNMLMELFPSRFPPSEEGKEMERLLVDEVLKNAKYNLQDACALMILMLDGKPEEGFFFPPFFFSVMFSPKFNFSQKWPRSQIFLVGVASTFLLRCTTSLCLAALVRALQTQKKRFFRLPLLLLLTFRLQNVNQRQILTFPPFGTLCGEKSLSRSRFI
jgi:hypothetical protein